ncbi:MAG: enoyl-CoA hydratase/isomerase family protein [Promethearchaeota archaeon]|nr:MAG: enoyl-CoA hydratase/isomerase family protein [Candidatus Lokiarchaeota archaeon]
MSKMSEESVLIEESEDGQITTIKLNRIEKKNAINFDMMMGLKNAINQVERSDARVVVITGGEGLFSAGIDLNFLTGQEKDPEGLIPDLKIPRNFRYFMNTWLQPIFTSIEKMEKPVIAKIDGYCFGMGFELALACDLRFCRDTAQFSMLETNIGMNPDVGGTIRLVRLVGIPHTKDIALTGRRFDGTEAYRLGVVNRVAKSNGELDEILDMYTKEMISSGPLAVGLCKKLIDDCYGKETTFGLELETLVSSQLLQTKDAMAGALARLQRKEPKWRWK